MLLVQVLEQNRPEGWFDVCLIQGPVARKRCWRPVPGSFSRHEYVEQHRDCYLLLNVGSRFDLRLSFGQYRLGLLFCAALERFGFLLSRFSVGGPHVELNQVPLVADFLYKPRNLSPGVLARVSFPVSPQELPQRRLGDYDFLPQADTSNSLLLERAIDAIAPYWQVRYKVTRCQDFR